MAQRMTTIAGLTIALSYGVSRGLDADDLCSELDIDPLRFGDPLRMISFTVTERLWRTLVARLPEENVGIGIGRLARPEHYGFVGQFINQARNGLELLHMFARSTVIGDTGLIDDPVRVEIAGSEVRFILPPLLSAGIAERNEAVMVATVACLGRRCGQPVTPRCVSLSFPWSAKRQMLADALGCPVIWDAPGDALVLEHAPLTETLPGAQSSALSNFTSFVERKTMSSPGLNFAERVKCVVELQVTRGNATQQATATALGLSVRSLQRELQQAGIRYGDLLGDALKHVATELMRDRAQTLEEIALGLGYSELSSFSRSWKRLTGESPARYRTRILGLPEDHSKASRTSPFDGRMRRHQPAATNDEQPGHSRR
jgi:AraC-like DNA-binding protein